MGTPASLTTLAQKIEELFVTQESRLGFHHDETDNHYRVQEKLLSAQMLDISVPDEKHVEYARAIAACAEGYKRDFVNPLKKLTDEIGRELLNFEQVLRTSGEVNDGNLENLARWYALSKALYETRQMAIGSVEKRTEFDAYLPKIVIQNNGCTQIQLSVDQSREFSEGVAEYAALMQLSHENNEKIQKERDPLRRLLFPVEQPRTPPPPAKPISVHPLEGKAWFRLVKVLYVVGWIAGLGGAALVAFATTDFVVFIIGAGIVAVLLVALKKVFYYVTLGRATATEQPGKGFVDLEDLLHDQAEVRANNPALYHEIVEPFFQSWKERYGRRVPTQEVGILLKRVNQEMEQIREKKQKLIDKAAKEGATIDLATLRNNLEKTKAEYTGEDRDGYIRNIDNFLTSLEVKYGSAIPLNEADKLLDKLETDIEARGRTQGPTS